uniref:Uncharacterized protein n=1 Tax=Physcomitrium patens TaxID=3218 RepID=A0A7I4CVU1_PHYPA
MAATDGTTRQGSPLVRLSIRFYSRAFLPLKEFSYVEIRSVLDVEGFLIAYLGVKVENCLTTEINLLEIVICSICHTSAMRSVSAFELLL